MKKFTRKITEIIVHCTATLAGRDLHVADIDRYHRNRGFECIGYHYLITIDGHIEQGRLSEFHGAHCLGHNDRSISVAYVGGIDTAGNPADTRTVEQSIALKQLLSDLLVRYPDAEIHGHREFAAKACPCFDARKEYRNLKTAEP